MSGGFNPPIPYAPVPRKQADQKFCHACGSILHISAESCTACGAVQSATSVARLGVGLTGRAPPNHVFCRGCGQAMHQTAPYCPHCGAPQQGVSGESLNPGKIRIVAALLALILGGLGAHKFYLGEIGLAIVYLLFSWTFIPAIVGLIEGLVYLCMSDERFARKYG
jgi:TM2 domain-containing membrane protein YozV/ribosomal protein L37E